MTAQWESERQAIHKLQALREELEQVRREIEEAERNYDLNRAAELRHGRLPELERRLQAEEERLNEKQGGTRLSREEVTEGRGTAELRSLGDRAAGGHQPDSLRGPCPDPGVAAQACRGAMTSARGKPTHRAGLGSARHCGLGGQENFVDGRSCCRPSTKVSTFSS
jgi:hypothetical protein